VYLHRDSHHFYIERHHLPPKRAAQQRREIYCWLRMGSAAIKSPANRNMVIICISRPQLARCEEPSLLSSKDRTMNSDKASARLDCIAKRCTKYWFRGASIPNKAGTRYRQNSCPVPHQNVDFYPALMQITVTPKIWRFLIAIAANDRKSF
jgi:hypothetical protein